MINNKNKARVASIILLIDDLFNIIKHLFNYISLNKEKDRSLYLN